MSTHQWWKAKRVIITGGTSGLGLALAQQCLELGACVGIIARGRERVAALERAHPSLVGVVGDVSHKEDIYPVAMQLTGRLGGVDILVHNASSLGPVPLRLWADTDCEDFELALRTNLIGPHRLTRALLPALVQSRGTVVAISSDAAAHHFPEWGAYGASKAALVHAMKTWDAEMTPLVRFAAWDPGDMDTPLHAAAVPDANRALLRAPNQAAAELLAWLPTASQMRAPALPVHRDQFKGGGL